MNKVVALGELMLRLSPHRYNRFSNADSYDAYYGGCEANVAISLAQFGHDVEYVTKLPDNDLGQAAINTLRRYGVKTDNIVRGGDRIGIYFAENGASMRASKVIYDRKNSSFSDIVFDEFDFDEIFEGCEIFHISGISPALSEKCRIFIKDACKYAKEKNIKISYDFNYRANLWTLEECEEFSKEIFPYVNILIGYIPGGVDWENRTIDHRDVEESLRDFSKQYNIDIIASTLRETISASDNRLYAILFRDDEYIISNSYDIRIVDRIGGGDAFTAGVISEYIYGSDSKDLLEFAVAASAWKHTVYGDHNIANREEILSVSEGNHSGDVKR